MSGEVFMSMWTVYDHPADHPEHFVARRFDIIVGELEPQPTGVVILADTIALLRAQLPRGMTRLDRFEKDAKKIMEVWL